MLLRAAALTELLTLTILLLNLATAHYQPITSLAGPLHGCAYLAVIILTARHPDATLPAKLTSLIPGIGGVLTQSRYL